MKPMRVPRETQVVAIRHPDLPEDAPTVVYYHGPDTSDSGSVRLKSLLRDSGLPHLVLSHEQYEEQAASHVELALRCLAKNGHGIFDMHGNGAQRHVVSSGLRPHPEQLTADLLAWLAEKSAERLAGSPQRGTPVFHLLSCDSGALRSEIVPGSPPWKAAYLMVYAGRQTTDESSYDCSLQTFLKYEKHCRDSDEEMDPLKMFFLAGMRRGGCITLMGGDLKAALTWHAPKTSAELQNEAQWRDRISGDPEDLERLKRAALSVSDAEKALLPGVERAAIDIFHARLERNDVSSLMEMLRKRSELALTPDAGGNLPIFNAVDNFSLDAVQLLEMYGAKLSAHNKVGDPLLIHAVVSELSEEKEQAAGEVISYLLEKGASPDQVDYRGYSALYCAVEAGRVDAVKLLLEHGASTSIAADGVTPLMLAKKMKHVKLIAVLSAVTLRSRKKG